MDIIQDEVTDDTVLFKLVISSLCDYIFPGPCTLRSVRKVGNNCIILYVCLWLRKHWRLMNQVLIFPLLQSSCLRDFKLRKSLEGFLCWAWGRVGRGGNSIYFSTGSHYSSYLTGVSVEIGYTDSIQTITHCKYSPSPRCLLEHYCLCAKRECGCSFNLVTWQR